MTNIVTNERCPGCGALISMVGRVHRCQQVIPTNQAKAAGSLERVRRWRKAKRAHYNAYMRDKMRELRLKRRERHGQDRV